jgi:aryl-alcohol dehydrogenase-like predicted oxidoreductase
MVTPAAMRRIVLGTVQLGLPYGRRAAEAALPLATAHAILDEAWALGIRCFDTAEAYGEASRRLASWIRSRGVAAEAEVVTKVLPSEPLELIGRALEPYAALENRTVLSHGLLLADRWSAFRAAAQAEGANAGQSVYSASEVDAAVSLPGVARVQAPGNPFDHAALEARGAAPVALDIRSVYLQGVLLESPDSAERRAPGTGMLARAVGDAARAAGEDPAVLLVAAMLVAVRPQDRLVLGVDSPEQLRTLERALTLPQPERERFAQELRRRRPTQIPAAALDPRAWASAT